jgi:tetratricopeptide (TPR) repeat protein
MPNRNLLLGLFIAVAWSLTSGLLASREAWMARSDRSGSVLKRLFGDGRRMFANHFYAKADAYFHRGFYPSIFDEVSHAEERHMAEAGQKHDDDHEAQVEHALHAPPRDWIERLNRHTAPMTHVELEGEETREILPWIKLAVELDPHQVEAYTVAAYWLRTRLGKVKEAEQFLREGLRENPDSHEILYELGQLIEANHQDMPHACNVYELALKRWEQQEATKSKPDLLALGHILIAAAKAEEKRGELTRAIGYLERLKPVSPSPEAIQSQIDELRGRMNPAR